MVRFIGGDIKMDIENIIEKVFNNTFKVKIVDEKHLNFNEYYIYNDLTLRQINLILSGKRINRIDIIIEEE